MQQPGGVSQPDLRWDAPVFVPSSARHSQELAASRQRQNAAAAHTENGVPPLISSSWPPQKSCAAKGLHDRPRRPPQDTYVCDGHTCRSHSTGMVTIPWGTASWQPMRTDC